MDYFGSAAHGIHGETSSVAEHIEYFPSFGILFEQLAVLALIDEEAGLLTFLPVDAEAQTVFDGGVVFVFAQQIAVFIAQICLEWKGSF